MESISWYKSEDRGKGKKFSIVIPTWNNLPLLKICINSIKKHSHFDHQIVLHVNEGEDGTLEWVKEQGLDYSYSRKNVGVCWAMNACRCLVDTEYILYLNDDMYLLPDWDINIWREIEKLPNNLFFISSSIIEPTQSSHPGVISPYNYGQDADSFDEEKLLREYKDIPSPDWHGSTWPPNIVHVNVWDLVGGYSIEYSPGFYSDPDFSMKLLRLGVKEFRGLGGSIAYHFGSKSTKRVKKNSGSRQFLNKWGVTSSTMCRYILRRGEEVKGDIDVMSPKRGYAIGKIKSKLKRIAVSFKGPGHINGI